MFAFGIFVGMGWISTQPQPQAQPIELVQTDRGPDLSDPEATDRYESDPGYLQIRNEYERLDNRVNRIESWLPESQGEARPALATMDRVQTAVGDLHQQFDLRRSQDLQFFVEWILATDQDSRIRDARTLQALGLVHAENNPNVRQR